ncbi:MAG: hypothetical protein VW829_11920, partial [Deltaproteobacteria bacterium]
MRYFLFILSLIGTAFLSSCGGSGGGSDPNLLTVQVEVSEAGREARIKTFADIDNVSVEVFEGSSSRDNITLSKSGNLWSAAFQLTPGTYRLEGRAYDNESTKIFEGETQITLNQDYQRIRIPMSSVENQEEGTLPRLRSLYYRPAVLKNSKQSIQAVISAPPSTQLQVELDIDNGSLNPASFTLTTSTTLTSVETEFTAPNTVDNLTLQVKVTEVTKQLSILNQFPIRVVDEQTTVPFLRFQPVIFKIKAERVGDNLTWEVTVRDDDKMSLENLQATWAFAPHDNETFYPGTSSTDLNEMERVFTANMTGYESTDNGSLVFSVYNAEGDNTTLNYPVPLNWFPDQINRNTQRKFEDRMSLGGRHSCLLLDNGTVKCWGANDFGQLGTGDNSSSNIPRAIPNLVSVVQVSLGGDHTCALHDNTTVSCWGANDFGQLGTGDNSSSNIPRAIPNLVSVRQIAAGEEHSCALLDNGSARCWGAQEFGRLGNGQGGPGQVLSPTPVQNLQEAAHLALGSTHSCALLDNDSVQCWGKNTAGQLGDGTDNNSSNSPVNVQLTGTVNHLAVGSNHNCVVIAGQVKCWGSNDNASLGNGGSADARIPTTVLGILDATKVFAGGQHSCALRSTGTALCWGLNTSGQLGLGDNFSPVYSPSLL